LICADNDLCDLSQFFSCQGDWLSLPEIGVAIENFHRLFDDGRPKVEAGDLLLVVVLYIQDLNRNQGGQPGAMNPDLDIGNDLVW